MDGCSSLLQRSFIVARITCGLIGQDIRRLVIELEGLEIVFSSLQRNRARRTRDCVLVLAERLASKEKNCQAEFRPVLCAQRLPYNVFWTLVHSIHINPLALAVRLL